MKKGVMKRLELIESTLNVIEGTVRRSFDVNQWLIIHQGNDYY